MNIRLLKSKEDFTKAVDLFKEWKVPEVVYNTFSTTGVGVFDKDENLLGVMFVYFTNSPIVHLDNLCVSISKTDKNQRTKIIDSLVGFVSEEVKKTGTYQYIIAEPIYKKSKERLLAYGFTTLDEKDNKFWKEVA